MVRMPNPFLLFKQSPDSYPIFKSQHDKAPVGQILKLTDGSFQWVVEMELIGLRCVACNLYKCEHLDIIMRDPSLDAKTFWLWWEAKRKDRMAKDWPVVAVRLGAGSVNVKLMPVGASPKTTSTGDDIKYLNVLFNDGPNVGTSMGMITVDEEGFGYIQSLVVNAAAGLKGTLACGSKSHWRHAMTDKELSEKDTLSVMETGICTACSGLSDQSLIPDEPGAKWEGGMPAFNMIHKFDTRLFEGKWI